MATDQKPTHVVTESPGSPAIENELLTYRAISPRAIFSLICGFLALFSLANPAFYLFAILAVVLGVTADWKIQRYPDMLTGRGMAQAGIAMGLIFGLSIFTVTTVRDMLRTRNASEFAQAYGKVFKNGTLGDVLWLSIPPSERKSMTPEDAMQRMASGKKQDQAMIEMKIAPTKNLKKRLSSSADQEIHFVRIEREGADGLTTIALALFEVHGTPNKDFPQEREYALAYMHGTTEGGNGYEWWVDDVTYPYTPQSAVIPDKPAGDGHNHEGHSH